MDVEPALTYLSEGALDNSLKLADPTLLSGVELDLSDAGGLDLFEFLNSEGLAFDRNVVDTVVL